MTRPLMSTELLLSVLGQLPDRYRVAAEGLCDAELRGHPEPFEWSAIEQLAHVRVGAEIHGEQRVPLLLLREDPIIATTSPRRWDLAATYLPQAFWAGFADYATQRARLVARLIALSPADWQRRGRLIGLRRPVETTVQLEISALVRHEAHHLGQFRRTTQLLRLGEVPDLRNPARPIQTDRSLAPRH